MSGPSGAGRRRKVQNQEGILGMVFYLSWFKATSEKITLKIFHFRYISVLNGDLEKLVHFVVHFVVHFEIGQIKKIF